MTILGFGYDEVFSSDDVPMNFVFDKEKETCTLFYTTLVNYDDFFIIVKNEIVLKEDMHVLFVFGDGLIQGVVKKIDYDKERIKVGKTWLAERDYIIAVGINNSNFSAEEILGGLEDTDCDII